MRVQKEFCWVVPLFLRAQGRPQVCKSQVVPFSHHPTTSQSLCQLPEGLGKLKSAIKMGVGMLCVYQSWKLGAGWPFHSEPMHSFPFAFAWLFPPQARHKRKSSRIVLLNQWLHCAGSCSFQEQFFLLEHHSLCPQASAPHKLRISVRAQQGQRVLNSVSCQSKETALWFSVQGKKTQKTTLTGFYSDISQCLWLVLDE